MAPKSKSTTNGTAPKGKASAAPSTDGTTTPVSDKNAVEAMSSGSGRPDKKVYDAEQEKIKGDIDALQVKLSAVRDKISLATSKSGNPNDKRATLRAELDGLRDKQSTNKTSRGKVLDQIKVHQENISKKIKDLQAAKTKIPFKTVAEVDNHIKNLEKQVESGSMKLADEKRALQEINQTKRNRRVVESFQSDQETIESERKIVDELKKQLDDPEAKAISDRYEAIKAELDELKKEGDELYAGRAKLFEERDGLQGQINTLYNQKRESTQTYKDANDRYWTKVNEDRARRAEKARAQRAAEEAAKKQEVAERLLEEARMPAYQAQIEDCQTLIDYFLGKSTGTVTLKSQSQNTPLSPRGEVAGVPKLELRQVDAAPEGLVVRKKKGEGDDAYFVGGKGKGKGKKGTPKAANGATEPAPASANLNVPLPMLSALLTLSIPPPSSSADVPRLVEDLKTKKAWFEANQDRVTAENIAKAETDVKRLNGEAGGREDASGVSTPDVIPPNGGGERPGEPASTPAVTSDTSIPVPSDEVDQKLEAVQEVAAAES